MDEETQRRIVSQQTRSLTASEGYPAAPARSNWPVIGIFLLLLVAGIAYARSFLMPVVLAFLLTLVFSPVRRTMERRRVPPGLAATLIVGTLVALLTAAVVLLAEPATSWIEDAPRIGRHIEEKIQGILRSAEAVMEAEKQVGELARGANDEQVPEVVVREPSYFASLAFWTPGLIAQTVLTLVLLLLLLASGDMLYEKIVHVMPTFKDKRRAIGIAYGIERNLSRYLFTISVINGGLGLSIGFAMWLIGMPNPVLFGVIGFLLNFVPYLGAVSGVFIVTAVGAVTFETLGQAVLPGAIYLALTASEGQLITPYFVGRRLKMNTVAVFLAIAFWAWLWSVFGMLVAVPLLVTIRTFCEHIPKLEPIGDFLSARGGEVTDEDAPSST